MTRITTYIVEFLREEEGNATVEFVIWFPFIMYWWFSAFEASFINMRQVLLGSAVDRTVRDLQLGYLGANPSHEELKVEICTYGGYLPNCMDRLHLELERISPDDFSFRQGQVQCVDVADETAAPLLNLQSGGDNDLMLITACLSVDPMVPLTGLGLQLPKINTEEDDAHAYAIIAFSAYVVEPE